MPQKVIDISVSMKLEPGKEYLYCACGLSDSQPFCDGSHIGTPFKPLAFVAKNQVYSSICLCRQASEFSLPYCDGSHSSLDF
jgi:CDGSH-type Zn-finger protein